VVASSVGQLADVLLPYAPPYLDKIRTDLWSSAGGLHERSFSCVALK